MCRMPYVEHRVDGLTGPLKAGNLLPSRLPHSTTAQTKTSTSIFGDSSDFNVPLLLSDVRSRVANLSSSVCLVP